MKNSISLIPLLIFSTLCNGQVGVNTSSPAVTLDITGRPLDTTMKDGLLIPRLTGDQLKAKDAIYGTGQNSTLIYVIAAVGTASQKTINVTSPGYYYYDAGNSVWIRLQESTENSGNTGTALYAVKNGAWSLSNLGISGTNWNKISLSALDVKTGTASLFNTGVYTAPKNGVYEARFEIQLMGGIDLSILGGRKLGILKNGTLVFDEKTFDAVRVSILGVTLAAVPVTSTVLSTLVRLNAGETLSFAVETGGVNLNVLTDGKALVSVYKVSD